MRTVQTLLVQGHSNQSSWYNFSLSTIYEQNPFLQKANVIGPLNIDYVSAYYTDLPFY